ncbi:MAG TPA: tRNA (N6-isopentenyl adenosine(37)-C2)-methylthiotransferase MiaB [Candidatus Spyradocola merdavium]|nr:tRNA (N6-isopentenyl adenosine(37)-C2)-methylthiotransferase MiaB [Candidatus Spyradocola merdavium]
MAQSLVVSQEEMDKQRQCAARVREGFPGRTYKIVTYGCQMNAHDSENLAGMLEEMGFAPAADEGEADLLLFNTCCIRDNAERRLLGNVSALAQRKREKPDLLVGVCGCMMQQEGGAQRLLDLCPFVDLVFGTHNLYRLPELLLRALRGQPVRETDGDERGCIPEGLPVRRTSAIQGALTIMYGCNNFCTYCVVPYVRGRERSRSVADVVREAESMAASGIQEILLLGQNVNSYAGGATFPELLRALDGVVPRIRFMTSHPKDLSDALIEEMARSRSVCPQFHLPVQSGNDKVLREMNRVYTRAHYLERVRALRQAIPEVGLTTDVIAGFPGETEAEFADTLSLVEEVQYDSAFTFIYSPRRGTRAAARPDQIPEAVQHERLDRLIRVQERATASRLAQQVGSVQEVLVEGASRRREGFLAGRTGRGMTVNFPGDAALVGKIVPVRILGTGANTLRGERA